MPYTVRLRAKAEKHLAKIPADQAWRIKRVLAALGNDPYLGKKLKGDYEGFYSTRMWPYRILYTIIKETRTIIIVDIDHRQGVYK